MTTLAVIGMGPWGRRLIRVFDGLADVRLACNRGDEDAHAWLRATYPSIRPGSSAAEAIDDPSIDAVVIATSIPSHAALAIASLEGGKHVFVEKPLATTAAEAERVIAAARAARRTLFVGHTFLFDAAFEALHDIVDASEIASIHLSWLKDGTFGEPLVWNLLPHEVALATWLAGRPPTLSIVEHRAGPTAVDRLVVDLAFDGGSTGTIEIDRLHRPKVKTARVRLRSGDELLWQDGNLSRTAGDGQVESLVEHVEESLVREAQAFLDAIASGDPGRSDGEFGLAVVRAIEPVALALEATRSAVPEPVR